MFENVENIRQDKKLHHKAMNNWKVELAAKGERLAEVKIQKSIFKRGSKSTLLSIIEMMPLDYTFRKSTVGYKSTKVQEKVTNLMYMYDIKIFAKKN